MTKSLAIFSSEELLQKNLNEYYEFCFYIRVWACLCKRIFSLVTDPPKPSKHCPNSSEHIAMIMRVLVNKGSGLTKGSCLTKGSWLTKGSCLTRGFWLTMGSSLTRLDFSLKNWSHGKVLPSRSLSRRAWFNKEVCLSKGSLLTKGSWLTKGS